MLLGKSTRDYHTNTLKIKKRVFTDQGNCTENLPKSFNSWALQFFVFMYKKYILVSTLLLERTTEAKKQGL